jgi:hypothetical protein
VASFLGEGHINKGRHRPPPSASLFMPYCIILVMNKRAKKRVKEAIEKDNLRRANIRKEQNFTSSKDSLARRAFPAKLDQKRA